MKNIQTWQISIIIGFVALTVTIPCGCSNEPPAEPPINSGHSDSTKAYSQGLVFDMLAGTWKSEDGKTYELWIKKPDGTFQSRVYRLNKFDTIVSEEAIIYQEKSRWVFENKVKGQNEGQSIKFYSTQLTNHSVQFSNPAHDFPTDVNYTLPDSNTIRAFIIGPNKKGNLDTIPFNYNRIK